MKKYFFLTLLALISLVVACEKESASELNTISDGKSGSLAGFKVIGNYLYAIDDDMIYTFNISDPQNLKKVGNGQYIFGVETLFAYKEYLLIGTTNGMYITQPKADGTLGTVSQYQHITTCDPVVAENNIAYVTLRSGRTCFNRNFNNLNALDVLDISDVNQPRLIKQYNMTFPEGLGIDGKNLFICDDVLKRYDATNPNDLKLVDSLTIKVRDVIPLGGTLLALSETKITEIDYTSPKMSVLSTINLK